MPAVEATVITPPRPRFDHVRDEGVGEGDDRLAVDPDHLGLALGVEVQEAAAEAEAGVVDQEVDVDAELRDLAGSFAASVARSHSITWAVVGSCSASAWSRSLRRATRIRS